jgi:hypothetical protein
MLLATGTAELTESPAPVRIFVLHDDAVDDLPELLEVSLQSLVGGRVVETSDEDLPDDFALRTAWTARTASPSLLLGHGPLEVDLGVVQGVRRGLEASLGLVHGRVSDEPETAGKNHNP